MGQPFYLDNWQLHPLKGNTDNAFMGVNGSEKVFIKKNASPFLAALSREGIAPRLVWVRRTSNGDTLTAQEWLECDQLSPADIGNRLDVVRTLRHIHFSESLKNMLYRVGGQEVRPLDMLRSYVEDLPDELARNHYLTQVFTYLENRFPDCPSGMLRVNHGDVNHRNWLLSEEGRLYLVDWDAVHLADPASDLGMLLGRYISVKDWQAWLVAYGVTPTPDVMERIRWYSVMHQMNQIRKVYHNDYYQELNQEILLLKEIFDD